MKIKKDSFEGVGSQITDQTNKINAAKLRLAELEREEKELMRRAEVEFEKSKYILTPPNLITAVDIMIAGFVFSKIFYQLWKSEIPDVVDGVLILIGIVLIVFGWRRFKQNYDRNNMSKQIEDRLKIIANDKAQTEKIITSSNRHFN